MSPHEPLIYVHIGDLHITTADTENFADFQSIIGDIQAWESDVDFVYLPGDNADNGRPEQYALVTQELRKLKIPTHVITGDHDMEPGDLTHFKQHLCAAPLPARVDIKGLRCLFLDMCGPGGGGPDFRLGHDQVRWLDQQLQAAREEHRHCIVFMHSYPADLKAPDEAQTVTAALASPEVLLVDMGHTHYNEIANDGRTIYAATRSTGQIEEGPVGFTVIAVDEGVVSWRFRKLADNGPIVLITAPADRRLVTSSGNRDHTRKDGCDLRVSVLSPHPITSCVVRIDQGSPLPLNRLGPKRFSRLLPLPVGTREILVEAQDGEGRIGRERIELPTEADSRLVHGKGSDADAIGAWPDRDIFGTQLGPNRNGRQW